MEARQLPYEAAPVTAHCAWARPPGLLHLRPGLAAPERRGSQLALALAGSERPVELGGSKRRARNHASCAVGVGGTVAQCSSLWSDGSTATANPARSSERRWRDQSATTRETGSAPDARQTPLRPRRGRRGSAGHALAGGEHCPAARSSPLAGDAAGRTSALDVIPARARPKEEGASSARSARSRG